MLFVGASHSGKSTLANFFLSKGAELYSEDICVLRNNDHFHTAITTIHKIKH